MQNQSSKVAISGIEMRVLTRELSQALTGSYVSNVHSLGEALLFRMRKGGEPEEKTAVISPQYGAWLTDRLGHSETNEFTTSVRGAVMRSQLKGVTQYDLDRVAFFDFTGVDSFRLILEVIPPGNIVITDKDGKIILAMREEKGPRRRTMRGAEYTPPPSTRVSPERLDREMLSSILSREKTVGKALGKGLTLPRRYVDEVLARASLAQEDTTPLPEEKQALLFSAIEQILQELSIAAHPCLIVQNGVLEVMSVTPHSGEVVKSAASLSALLDEVLSPLLLGEVETEGQADYAKKLKELEVTIDGLEQKRTGLRARSVQLRETASSLRGAPSVEDARNIVKETPELTIEERNELLTKESSASISSGLFDLAKELEFEARRVDETLTTMARRLERTKKLAPASSVPVRRSVQREWYEKFRWFFTSSGKLAVGGRDSQSNSLLVKKHMNEGDVAYHADLFGSPFFILKGGREQSEAEIREMGSATASFSSAWKTGLSSADAYWVLPEQVSTTAPSGEYLARGSFVIRGKKNFVNHNRVEIAVGLDERGRIISGPEECVMRLSRAHVALVPHKEKTSDTAKRVLNELRKFFSEGQEKEELLKAATLDDVMRMLPAGGGKIIRKRENWKKGEKKPEQTVQQPQNVY